MKTADPEKCGFQQILEAKEADLAQALGRREHVAIEKSSDQMDEIQFGSERDLAIGNLNREFQLLREVKAALGRIHDGSFGTCIQCECAISLKRLGAVPWARRCIQCEEAAARDQDQTPELFTGSLASA